MLHSAAGDCNSVQLFLVIEGQKRQNDESVSTNSGRRASHHSPLIDSARVSLQSHMLDANETCFQSLFCKVAGCTRNCGEVCHSDADAQLAVYEFTVQQGMHSILVSLNHSLESPCRDDAPPDPQRDSGSLRSTPSQ